MVKGSPEYEASINTNESDMITAEAALIDNISTDDTDVEINLMNDGRVSDVITVNDNTDKTNNHFCDEVNNSSEVEADYQSNLNPSPSEDVVREEVETIGELDFKMFFLKFVCSEAKTIHYLTVYWQQIAKLQMPPSSVSQLFEHS